MKTPLQLSFLLLVLLLAACQPTKNDESAASAGGNAADGDPKGKVASRNDTTVISLLSDICGNKVDEIMQVDDYRDRIGKPWGSVVKVLRDTRASFRNAGDGICEASGKLKHNGVSYEVIMVLDKDRDVVFGAQWDDESGEVQTWAENDSIAQPETILEWVAVHSAEPGEQ